MNVFLRGLICWAGLTGGYLLTAGLIVPFTLVAEHSFFMFLGVLAMTFFSYFTGLGHKAGQTRRLK